MENFNIKFLSQKFLLSGSFYERCQYNILINYVILNTISSCRICTTNNRVIGAFYFDRFQVPVMILAFFGPMSGELLAIYNLFHPKISF